jgi:hypothetical protein
VIRDRNGDRHECRAEAFDATYNVLILLYPVKALTASTVIMLVEGGVTMSVHESPVWLSRTRPLKEVASRVPSRIRRAIQAVCCARARSLGLLKAS